MTTFAESTHDPVRTVQGVSCNQCVYDLSGLEIDGHCPECGHPIIASVEPPRLDGADPESLRRVYTGLRLAFWLVIIGFVMGGVVGIIGAAVGAASGMARGVAFAMSLLYLIPAGLQLYAWHLITKDVPRMPDPTRRGLLRRSILGILWVFLAIAVFDTIIGPVLNRSGWKTGAGIIAAMSVLFGLLSSLVGFVLLLFEVAYLRRLADFVPDRRLSQRFHTLYTVALYAIPVFVLVSGVFVLIGYLLPTGPGQAGFSPFLLVALPASIFAVGLFVYQIFFLVALFKIGSRAGVALKQAEEREQEIAYNASRIA